MLVKRKLWFILHFRTFFGGVSRPMLKTVKKMEVGFFKIPTFFLQMSLNQLKQIAGLLNNGVCYLAKPQIELALCAETAQ